MTDKEIESALFLARRGLDPNNTKCTWPKSAHHGNLLTLASALVALHAQLAEAKGEIKASYEKGFKDGHECCGFESDDLRKDRDQFREALAVARGALLGIEVHPAYSFVTLGQEHPSRDSLSRSRNEMKEIAREALAKLKDVDGK